MKNNKPEAVIIVVDEDKRLKEYKLWNSFSEKKYLQKAYESLNNANAKAYSIDELDARLEKNFV